MFKYVFFIIATLAVTQIVHGQISDDSDELRQQMTLKLIREQLKQKIQFEFMREKLNGICPGYGSRLQNVTAKVAECADTVEEENETLCSLIKENLSRCFQPVVDLFEECLPERSIKVPSLILKMALATTKYICKIDGEHLLELQNNCLRSPTPKLARCLRKAETARQKIVRSKQYPSAEEICELLQEIRPCFTSHVQTACGHPITREAILNFANEGVFSVCQSYEMNENELVAPILEA